MTEKTPAEVLTDLRVDIDRIDAAMHDLLIERGGIIERLIAVKARQGGGSAFRPGREAEMMRRIAERHRGPLPLDTVESIWRVIISTFTFVQSAYAVHAVAPAGPAADRMRDSVRFHFGFTVPLITHAYAAAVVQAVMAADNDLGMIPVDTPRSSGPWWYPLGRPDAPKVIARLPFIERDDHPAGLPVYVVAKPSAAAAVRDTVLFRLSIIIDDFGGEFTVNSKGFPPFEALGAEEIDSGGDEVGQARLVSVPGALAERFEREVRAFDPGIKLAEVGSHATRTTIA